MKFLVITDKWILFEEEYDPGKFQYKLNKDGRILFDEEGNPIS